MSKRKAIGSMLLISFLFSFAAFTFSSTTVQANGYGSNGQIGFYGDYEEPKEDDNEPGEEPGEETANGSPEGTTPEADRHTKSPTTTGAGSSYGTTASGSRTLPQTGQTNYFGMNVMGSTLLGFLLLIIVKNKKGESNE